jgi:hypothetical protein
MLQPKPNASNMQITSVKTKTADPNPQQARYERFRVRIACVFMQLNCLQLTLNNPQSRMPEITPQVTFVRTEKKSIHRTWR